METTEQIVREAPDIEAYKLGLMKSAQALPAPVLPAYQVAGMTPEQEGAIAAGRAGIGAFAPYLQAGAGALGQGINTMAEAADVMRGADTRGQFAAAQQAYDQAMLPASALGNLSNVAGAGIGFLGAAGVGLGQAQDMASAASRADLAPSQEVLGRSLGQAQGAVEQAQGLSGVGIGSLYDAAGQAAQAARLGQAPTAQAAQMQAAPTSSYSSVSAPELNQYQMGPAERVSAQSLTAPGAAEAYMSPYMQNVVGIQQREAQRQADIAGTQRAAQAVKAGAFGGTRQAVERAEAARNLATQLGDIQAAGLQSAYQQAQQQFNAEQSARLAAQQANQQAGLTVGSQNLGAQLSTQQLGTQAALQSALANQQAGMQTNQFNAQQAFNTNLQNAQMEQQANLANQAMQGQYGIQGAQLGLQAADALRQAGIGTLGAAQNMGALGMQGAQQTSNVGQQLGAQELQQAQLGQSAAGLYGNLASQQGNLAGQYANIAGQQANILGQQSQLQQQIGQGIGQLAGQQFGIGQAMAQGLGALGTQAGNLGVQQAGLGQLAQGMGQQDVNFLYNLGAQQQKQDQAELDALRATKMQEATQPYQQLAFQSDIYKGAPSTQMAVTQQAAPSPSPFQQIAGLGTGILGTAAAANAAGKLFGP